MPIILALSRPNWECHHEFKDTLGNLDLSQNKNKTRSNDSENEKVVHGSTWGIEVEKLGI